MGDAADPIDSFIFVIMHFIIEHQHLNVFTTAQDDSIQFITFYSNFYIPLKFFNVMNETSEEVSINFYCL